MQQNNFDRGRRIIDAVCLVFVALLLTLTSVFAEKVPHWQELSIQLIATGALYLVASVLIHRLSKGLIATMLRTVAVLALFGFLFQAVDGLQHIIFAGWMDDVLISAEFSLTGTESSLFLRNLTNPVLTEWMMFAYVIYVPLLPLMALICYRSAGPGAANSYLLNLALANILCYLGFILFPVASPLYHWPEMYSTPLHGGFFSWCGEWIRHNQHYAGGSLPSPHCAAGTVMLVMLYRHNRQLFYVGLPTILTLYVSTVYGRYHYAWDGIAGILSAAIVLRFNPRFLEAMNAVLDWLKRLTVVRSIPSSVSELN